MKRNVIRKGWIPDFPDFRDLYYKDVHSPQALGIVVDPSNKDSNTHITTITNNSISLRDNPKMPPIYDQGQLGSCTAQATEAMWAFVHGGGPYSRLQLYYDSRVVEGDASSDSGAQIRDVIMTLVKTGTGLETDWPYIESKFADKPTGKVVIEEATDKATIYSRLQSAEDYRNCLDQGFPFVIGISVYSSFESDSVASSGIVPMPTTEDSLQGGHAICVVGYCEINGTPYYEARNSWGTDWGNQGYFFIQAAYLENPDLACDSWTLRK